MGNGFKIVTELEALSCPPFESATDAVQVTMSPEAVEIVDKSSEAPVNVYPFTVQA